LKNWADSRKGARPVGFPRFKSRRRTTPGVRFTTGAIRVEPDRMPVVLPRLSRRGPGGIDAAFAAATVTARCIFMVVT